MRYAWSVEGVRYEGAYLCKTVQQSIVRSLYAWAPVLLLLPFKTDLLGMCEPVTDASSRRWCAELSRW